MRIPLSVIRYTRRCLLIDAPRPGTTQFALQRFGLADSGERLTLDFPNRTDDPQCLCAVVLDPPCEIFEGSGIKL
jgi:hypothetical protein